MFENIAAIDVGTSSIKVVTVRTGLRDFQLKALNYEDINPDIEDRAAAVSEALQKILAEEDLAQYHVITNLPMEMEIIRNISFPFSDVEKIADAIPYEAEENIPFKMDDLVMDFQSLKSNKENEGRILLAAAHKANIKNFIETMGANGLQPVRMGMEANALFECYRYFNRIENEAVILMDIGNNKSILNFIENNHLLYTRSIPIGMDTIKRKIAHSFKLSLSEATLLFLNLNLDLTSIDNNLQRDYYKSLGLSRQKLQKVFDIATDAMDELIEQVLLTVKALQVESGEITFNRALISGGGSNMMGIGSVISRELDIPVDGLPFLDEYKERNIRTQFPIAFGTILAHINQRRSSINFLKGEFIPDVASESKKIYYLSGGFAIMTVLILIINLIMSSILSARSNSQYSKIIGEQYRQYFHTNTVPADPISEAARMLKKEKKEMESVSKLIPRNTSFLEIMRELSVNFPQGSNFVMNNLVYNENVIMIDGTAGSSTSLDSFKEGLLKTKKYESVILNIKYSRASEVRFSMTIKHKLAHEEKKDNR